MRKRINIQAARERNLPHCTAASVGLVISVNEDATAEEHAEAQEAADKVMASLDIYLEEFADTGGKCPNCDLSLGGFIGTFTWGLCHGEGNCSCGWPCRGAHYPKDANGGDMFYRGLDIVLPYHPDFVEAREPDTVPSTEEYV